MPEVKEAINSSASDGVSQHHGTTEASESVVSCITYTGNKPSD